MWNDLLFTVFDTGTLNGFNGAVNPWLTAHKDPLDFDAARLAQKLVDWTLDPKQARHVKQRDREEIDFLQSMVKYEAHFNEDDKKKLHKRLRLFYLVSDLNWNAALNDQKEVNREDFGIEVSSRTAALRPYRRGRGRGGPSRGGARGRRGAGLNYGRGGGAAGRGGANA